MMDPKTEETEAPALTAITITKRCQLNPLVSASDKILTHVQPVFWLRPGLPYLLPVELVRDDTLLVGLQAINSLEAIFGREVAGLSGTVVCPPVCDESDEDGEEAEEEVHDLVSVKSRRVNATETVNNWRTEKCAKTVTAVPTRHAEGLLGASVEGDCNDREERNDGRLECAQ